MRRLIARWRAWRWRRMTLRQRCLAISIGTSSRLLLISLMMLGGLGWALAQSSAITGCCLVTNGSYAVMYDGCDTNDRTPAEALDCKLDAWRKRLAEAQQRKGAAEKDIDKAQERISAFTDAKRQKN